jgi:hypothetical protein
MTLHLATRDDAADLGNVIVYLTVGLILLQLLQEEQQTLLV